MLELRASSRLGACGFCNPRKWVLQAPTSLGFLFFAFSLFLSNDLEKSMLGEICHAQQMGKRWQLRKRQAVRRVRKQRTTYMFHHKSNYTGVKFGTSVVKTSFKCLLRLEPPPPVATERGKRNPICCSRVFSVQPCNGD